MKEEGRSNTYKSYMRFDRGGPPDTPLLYYRYHPYRNSDFIKEFLNGFHGYDQSLLKFRQEKVKPLLDDFKRNVWKVKYCRFVPIDNQIDLIEPNIVGS